MQLSTDSSNYGMFISKTGCSHALFQRYYVVFNRNLSVRCTILISERQLQPSIVAAIYLLLITSFLGATPATSSEYVVL